MRNLFVTFLKYKTSKSISSMLFSIGCEIDSILLKSESLLECKGD